jgi:hypothetical protein
MDRILKGTPATVSRTFYTDGAVVDPGAVTLTITTASGTTVVSAVSTSGSGAAARTYNVTAAQTALLDTWTLAWTSSTKGTLSSVVEIVGGFVFSIADLIAVQPSNFTWTAAQMEQMRTTVEDAIEEHYGTALVPRYRREKVSGDGTTLLGIPGPIRAIRDITVNGTALDAATIAALYLKDGWLSGYTWTAGIGNIIVGYECGLDEAPGRIRQDAVRLARQWLVSGPIDDRALGAASPDGQFSYGLATPGRNGSIFGLPDLDAVVMASPYRVGVA